MVCAELRKQFGVPIEKLAWLQKFMLQEGADHFSAAVEMMKHGLAVLILTDLSHQFDMDADFAIGTYSIWAVVGTISLKAMYSS